jgi:hypothetical protein
MVTLACAVFAYLCTLFLLRHKLALQAAALRQQLAVLKRALLDPDRPCGKDSILMTDSSSLPRAAFPALSQLFTSNLWVR